MNESTTTAEGRSQVLRSPGDVAAHLGALVGFEPTASIVAILTRDGQVIVTMRSDIPDDDWVALAGQIVRVADQADPAVEEPKRC